MSKPTAIARDDNPSFEAMAIVDKYEVFLNYLYPKVQNCPRKHGVLRDAVLAALFVPVPGFHAAGKTKQISRLYAVDADIAVLRFWLRFMANSSRAIITEAQCKVAMRHLNEVGSMLGAWIQKTSTRQIEGSRSGGAASAREGLPTKDRVVGG
ncbi:MAG: diversity-generating retroelement protein Avd [Hyphomicrobium sp.]